MFVKRAFGQGVSPECLKKHKSGAMRVESDRYFKKQDAQDKYIVVPVNVCSPGRSFLFRYPIQTKDKK